ncbi:MAG TPA: HAMP domain-containing sensor histidine kinase [Candidatus Saccharimonadales bacterium]|nr:HAMP domain-containing sensor histidine kinase [Candidatus Saccharimonadales bacterium]
MFRQISHIDRNCNAICKVALVGAYLMTLGLAALLFTSEALQHSVTDQVIGCIIALVFIIFVHILERQGRCLLVSYLLVLFYVVTGISIVWTWGINAPPGPLLLGIAIVFAGILLSARHALYTAVIIACLFIGVQLANAAGITVPTLDWTGYASSFGDVFAYCLAFGLLGLGSWLYNRQMERSLLQAKRAEHALLQQEANLKLQVKKRTEQLHQAQLEDMRQMYQFIQLGQWGVTLLHDLANHLTALTLEIEGLQQKRQHSEDIARAHEITRYLEQVVNDTRDRLHSGPRREAFNVITAMGSTIDFLRYKANDTNVQLRWQPPAINWTYTADPASFMQVMTILVNNAIDAYCLPGAKSDNRQVVVTMERDHNHIVVSIGNWGPCIDEAARKLLFKPFHSGKGKNKGMGIGLFIAKQIVEGHFNGTINCVSDTNYTEFKVTLPLAKKPSAGVE